MTFPFVNARARQSFADIDWYVQLKEALVAAAVCTCMKVVFLPVALSCIRWHFCLVTQLTGQSSADMDWYVQLKAALVAAANFTCMKVVLLPDALSCSR